MMPITLPTARRRARIEIIPLIDIIFFLLATFVLVSLSMVKNQGVPVRLPVSATSQALAHAETLILRISKEGTVSIDRQDYSLEQLHEPLETFQKSQADPKVILQGDTDAAYGKIIAVLDEVRRAGISKVAIQTAHKKP